MKNLQAHRKPRLKTALWGEVTRVGHGNRQVLVEELSETGARFRCDHATSVHLMPERQRAPGALLGVRVILRLTLPGLQRAVEVHCRLVFCRRFSQDSYRFECLFDPPDTLHHQRVRAWLRRQLEREAEAAAAGVGAA